MRTRRVKIIDPLEGLADELFEVMYADDSNEFFRECTALNCALYATACVDVCKNPCSCKQFQFNPGHKFARFNEILYI